MDIDEQLLESNESMIEKMDKNPEFDVSNQYENNDEVKPAVKLTLEETINSIENAFAIEETDTTWGTIDNAIKSAIGVLDDGTITRYQLIKFIEKHREPFENSIKTNRTRLTGSAVTFFEQASIYLKEDFVSIIDWVAPAILWLTVRTNKITVTRAVKCLSTISRNTQLHEIIPHYYSAHKHISQSLRKSIAQLMLDIINDFDQDALMKQHSLIEDMMHYYIIDALDVVRVIAKDCFNAYCEKYPLRKDEFIKKFTPLHMKYLKLETDEPEPEFISQIKKLRNVFSSKVSKMAESAKEKEDITSEVLEQSKNNNLSTEIVEKPQGNNLVINAIESCTIEDQYGNQSFEEDAKEENCDNDPELKQNSTSAQLFSEPDDEDVKSIAITTPPTIHDSETTPSFTPSMSPKSTASSSGLHPENLINSLINLPDHVDLQKENDNSNDLPSRKKAPKNALNISNINSKPINSSSSGKQNNQNPKQQHLQIPSTNKLKSPRKVSSEETLEVHSGHKHVPKSDVMSPRFLEATRHTISSLAKKVTPVLPTFSPPSSSSTFNSLRNNQANHIPIKCSTAMNKSKTQ